MSSALRISKKLILFHWLRTKIWKGRKTATKTLKKRIRFSFWTKHGNLWQLSYPAKKRGNEGPVLFPSYIALLMRGMGLRSLAKKEKCRGDTDFRTTPSLVAGQ